ncbi:bacillithiol biosynthesis cysteine-adding enzyme BshC [Virgibacillus kimchii]
MQVDPVGIQNKSKLIRDYRANDKKLMSFFDYEPFTQFADRVQELKQRHFNRRHLTDVLHNLNRGWGAPEAALDNIERLKDENSTVVIGGQQAGLLTGPMYTVNKVISIIQFARQKEEELNIPVIPVFWIAGEDHDFDEINHVFLPHNGQMEKYKHPQKVYEKKPVSDIKINKQETKHWLETLFQQLQETEYTNKLYHSLENCLMKSDSYVDFFARLIHQLFEVEGLVLVDSAHPDLRKLEKDHFAGMIRSQSEIAESVHQSLKELEKIGYEVPLEAEEDDGHLFYHKETERILLKKTKEGTWKGKQNEVCFTTEELLDIAEHHPGRLSNNVVTRPLMQDLLFPTLAFIGGPGEIAYWASLKNAFHTLDINMPPVVPRLSFTFLERHIERCGKKYKISFDTVINEGTERLKKQWLEAKNNPSIQDVAASIKQQIKEAHQPLREIAAGISTDIGDLSEKNLFYLKRNIDYMEKRMMKAVQEKYEKEVSEFNMIHTSLFPNNNLQERMWTPLPWINSYSPRFISKLASESLSFENEHYIISI